MNRHDLIVKILKLKAQIDELADKLDIEPTHEDIKELEYEYDPKSDRQSTGV